MKEDIAKFFKGEIFEDQETLEAYSRDASLFRVRPKMVVFPNDSSDLMALTAYVSKRKSDDPTLSITIRAAGSCMSGGPINDSIVADVTKHMNAIGEIEASGTRVEPGVFYRDFEKKALENSLEMPAYPASKDLAAVGGMIGNNCGGEKTLRYGKMEKFVASSKYIFADGREYEVKPLTKSELQTKINQNDFEGEIYKKVFEIVKENESALKKAKPKVTKNSSGYFLWNVWDGEIFDLNRLLTGAQGTLGIMTEARLKLEPIKTHHDMIVLFFRSWDELPGAVNAILPFKPESLETFDEETLKLGIRFMPEIAVKTGRGVLSFLMQFLPEALIGLRMLGLPKLVVLVEIAEEEELMVKEKVSKIKNELNKIGVIHRVIEKDSEEEKFWVVRRESFALLRKHVNGKRTVPLVEDFCIPADSMPAFLPRAKKILLEHGIDVNIAGHAGDGNFHIIPLMNLKDEKERAKLLPVAEAFYTLISEFNGANSGEHNDGIVRTPYLGKMYSPEIMELFKKTKQIFDPKGIFNPNKKIGTTFEYWESHLDA